MSDEELFKAIKKYNEANRTDVFSLTKDVAIMESAIKTQALRINELEQTVQSLVKLCAKLVTLYCKSEK